MQIINNITMWSVENLPANATRAVKDYLARLDDAAFGAASEVTPKFVSPSDPAAQWTGALRGPAFFAYANNYLVDTDNAIIVDVEATRSIRQAEVGAARTMRPPSTVPPLISPKDMALSKVLAPGSALTGCPPASVSVRSALPSSGMGPVPISPFSDGKNTLTPSATWFATRLRIAVRLAMMHYSGELRIVSNARITGMSSFCTQYFVNLSTSAMRRCTSSTVFPRLPCS